MATKQERIQAYQDYITRETSFGVKHLDYFCPHCRFELKTRQPADGEAWDSLSTCPSCDGLFYRWARDQSVEVHVEGMRTMHNQELMDLLMDDSRHGSLLHAFLFTAIGHYCDGIAMSPAGFMDGHLVDEESWRAIAKHVGGFIKQRPLVKDAEYEEE
ncbi:hypothetical protein ACIGFL_14360 [Pseudomonas sp. NPDC077649]|uniref:hypothetical protein n=1 Tax=Pseudomonas sp. NPDC077649 TaxID=3364423 RepID=UPI0037C95B86